MSAATPHGIHVLRRLVLAASLAGPVLTAAPVRADEGMWTFDNFPARAVQARYGFAPDSAWLDKIRSSAVRLTSGCSASVVSGD
ncbi:MAG: S46 family peptidase, partial [Gammaproteobacteria bacterium]|nr:S46 family peptidase [Gammaproteobacteria bacterium]